MKAALEVWSASSNLFHQGFAKEVDDDEVIAATMEKPGVVLQRPVGSNDPFSEHSGLPTIEPLGEPSKKKHKASKPPKTGEKESRKAAVAFERERERREKQRQKEEAAAAEARARRQAAMSKAEAALEAAEQEHEAIVTEIEKDRAALDKRAGAEEARWVKKLERLEADLRKASR
jgi:colicin import membrane protein